MPHLITENQFREYMVEIDRVTRDQKPTPDPVNGALNDAVMFGPSSRFGRWNTARASIVAQQKKALEPCMTGGLIALVGGLLAWWWYLQRHLDMQMAAETARVKQLARLRSSTTPHGHSVDSHDPPTGDVRSPRHPGVTT